MSFHAALCEVGTMSEEQRCTRKCGYLLWCSCGPELPPRCIYPAAQKHHCRCFLCYKQIRESQLESRSRSVRPVVSSPAPTTQHIDKYRVESQICKRIVWPESTSLSRALGSIHNMIIPNTMQYVGITWNPLYRFHKIRDNEGLQSAHFPLHWKTMYIIAAGPRQ